MSGVPSRFDSCDTAVDGGQVGDVERTDSGLTAGFLGQRRCREGGPLDVAAVDHHPGTGLEQALGKGVTDPSAGARDQADPAAQIEHVHSRDHNRAIHGGRSAGWANRSIISWAGRIDARRCVSAASRSRVSRSSKHSGSRSQSQRSLAEPLMRRRSSC